MFAFYQRLCIDSKILPQIYDLIHISGRRKYLYVLKTKRVCIEYIYSMLLVSITGPRI